MATVKTNAGWISLDRSLLDHWVWQVKPFGVGQAWVDLLLLATYKDGKELYKGQLIARRRGEVHVSTVWLSNRWGWDRKKVTRTLKQFQSDSMIALDVSKNGTTIRIEKYAFYQNRGTTNGQRMDNEWTTSGHTITKEQGNKYILPLREEQKPRDFQEEAERILDKHRPGWRAELAGGGEEAWSK